MIYHSADRGRVSDKIIDTVQSDVDYVDSDGDIHIHTKVAEIVVTSAYDLASLSGYGVGSIAYTAGFANMWQLSASGDWVAIVEEAPSDNGGETPSDEGEQTPDDNGGE